MSLLVRGASQVVTPTGVIARRGAELASISVLPQAVIRCEGPDIVFVGDLARGRTLRSLAWLLTLFECVTLHFVARTSKPFASMGGWVDGEIRPDILEIAGQWNQNLETESLLTQMAEAATRLLGAERASIFLWDRPHRLLVGRPALGVEGAAVVEGHSVETAHRRDERAIDAGPSQRRVAEENEHGFLRLHKRMCKPTRSVADSTRRLSLHLVCSHLGCTANK